VPEAPAQTPHAGAPLDWRRARPGDRVAVAGGGVGVLAALPDRRGRVAVQLAGARVVVPMERVALPPAEPTREEARRERAPRVAVQAAGHGVEDAPSRGGSERCDLRGLRVDEALAELTRALDRAVLASRTRLDVVHGIGTGALREAVRAHLADSPYVERFGPAAPEAGGEGVTEIGLR
jgi:DNA mismatch repair protein MutS2